LPKIPAGLTQAILDNFYNYAKTCRNQKIEWLAIREALLNAGWQKAYIDFCCVVYGDGETKPVLAPVVPAPPTAPAPVVKTGTLGIPLPNLPVPL